MNPSDLTREQKESLYIKKETELQTRWKNPIDSDWDFIKEWSDQELEERLNRTTSQIKFEKTTSGIGKFLKLLILIVVALGVIGLIKFGLGQLF